MGMGMVNVILDFEEGLGSRWTLITGGVCELAEVISTTTLSTVLEIKSMEEVELVSSQSSHLPDGANALTKLASTGPPAPVPVPPPTTVATRHSVLTQSNADYQLLDKDRGATCRRSAKFSPSGLFYFLFILRRRLPHRAVEGEATP